MNTLQKNAILTALRMLGVDNLNDTITNAIVPLFNPENFELSENEKKIIGIISLRENEIFVERLSIDDKNVIVRKIDELQISDYLNNLINTLEN